jgi:saccharopine dehydrogenase-like NADP-dependent oxidoreductase
LKQILLFGAGKSASTLIDFLIKESETNDWKILIADANKELIDAKTKQHTNTQSIGMDITDQPHRIALIASADIVISMMPPALHILIAKDCIECGKNLLTASYADDTIRGLEQSVKEKGLLFLCEMGLDPGIDHMSALQIIDDIKESGGIVTSFKSHCGGLVAPESDTNPWHYKISWNPRNVVLAGKAGAVYLQNGEVVNEAYEQLFDPTRTVLVQNETSTTYSYYPNRNSLSYIDLYQLNTANTFIRTTLRDPEFMSGWKEIVSLQLTDESSVYETEGLSLKGFFTTHFAKIGLQMPSSPSKQLLYLGLEDDHTLINKGRCSAADVLQFSLESKLVLEPGDKDMIVMLHEIEYTIQGAPHRIESSLVVKGEDHIHTAMAKTVGLPLGIAAKLILNGTITLTGIHIPIIKEIYQPVMEALKPYGIRFIEKEG